MNKDIVCTGCNGTDRIQGTRWDGDQATQFFADCTYKCATVEEFWQFFRFILRQFISCKLDGPFDPDDLEKSDCAGCSYERCKIMNMIWHFGKLVEKEGFQTE